MNYLFISKVAQIVIALLLILVVMIQSKSQGLSSGIKGSFTMYRSLRGVEKLVFNLTIMLGILFVLNSLVIIYLA